MRVLILGEDAPGGLMASYAHGFTELGADVKTFCLARAYRESAPGIRTRVLRRLAETMVLSSFNDRVARALRRIDADLVLVLKGHRLSPVTVDRLREASDAPVVNFFPDDPFSRERSNRLAYGPNVIAAYDACFTFARHLIPAYERAGVQAVHYLPFARDPEQHAPVTFPTAPEFDVVFVGNLDESRVRCLEALAPTFRVGVFGERTSTTISRGSPLAKATFGPAAYGTELARTLARGAISLNVMRPQNASSHNMRSFESPACGAFTLSQRTLELTSLFAEGEEIACFSTTDELCETVDRCLRDSSMRARVANAGFQRVRDDTYARRASTILERVGIAAGVAP
ncbi:MAG TPA: glycosyltransferase [Gemmatimonadaceae bacterium]|nr:glycosyltransferase [Gemmatimonadaceae bacterium]